ncbi:MAG: efflux transporter outer membrane subunit [Rhodocyclales bacterium]|nr:efflux transporter outer membrane subunit [Rhodocyclales bacterium]
MRLRPLLLLLVTVLTGCAVGPAYERPPVELPSGWQSGAAEDRWPAPRWWRDFGDPTLDALEEMALSQNHDLRAAIERVAEARALLQVAAAGLYPSLDASAASSRQKSSSGNSSSITNRHQALLSASYELDLFGYNRAQAEAAAARLQGSEFDRRTVELGVTALTAGSWFTLAALEARLAAARESLDTARAMLGVVQAQRRAGMATDLQVAQQELEIATIEASIPPLQTQRTQAANALALLLGRPPQDFAPQVTPITQLRLPSPPAGLPSGLLERRPDVRSAEAALQAATADARAATAALYPRLDLTAQGGGASSALGQILDPGSRLFTLAATLSATLFDGGRLRGELAYSEARVRELAQTYQQTLLSAFGDVENALSAQRNGDEALAAQQRAVAQAQTALRIATLQYQQGMTLYLDVLTAQRSLLNARDAEVQARLARLNAALSLYQALGGGWEDAP